MAVFNPKYRYLKEDYQQIKNKLLALGYTFPPMPDNLNAKASQGEAYSKAYPIQGILKYHGFVGNQINRIAYFPSISLNNTAASTITYLCLDQNLKEDTAIINGTRVYNEKLARFKWALNFIRDISHCSSNAFLVSRNKSKKSGKGLGMSASASAALALAATSIIYENEKKFIKNYRLISIFSRYLSGSGCRSAMGGISLWLSYPEINQFDCHAIRLDTLKHKSFINKISLLTIPIESNIKTTDAHQVAPSSPFFSKWLEQRKSYIFQFLDALNTEDFNRIGEIAEYDTKCLHSITMTAPKDGFIAWKPKTLKIMQKVEELREKHSYHVYYTVDTGPSLVLLTVENEKEEIREKLKEILHDNIIMEGKIGGPSCLINPESRDAKMLKEDIEEFKNF